MLNIKLNQQGYLILETLITVGILSVGLLGISAMQITSLKSSFSAVQRGEAAYLIASMSDRMRANPIAVINGNYDNLSASAPATAPRTSPQAVAQYDFDIWQQEIERNFSFDPTQPDNAPEGKIDCPSTFNCILEINWQDTRADTSLQDTANTRYKHIASVVF